MFEGNRKENEKQYNPNSFRGFYGDKNKFEKDTKHVLQSPKNILNSIDKKEDTDRPAFKVKPRLLTGRLPAAFAVNTKTVHDTESCSPKKLIVNNNYEGEIIQLQTPSSNRYNVK
jgi:hypothetical protein